MKRSGSADLPLHYGSVPRWLYERMSRLGLAITEAILADYNAPTFLQKLADPFWFQSFGAVMGMDWHSSGITTSVMGALKPVVNARSSELGLYICGGKGKLSTGTPSELLQVAERTGLDGKALVRSSKLSAKVDNTAIQDGFQLYLHNFIVCRSGEWTVVQQGMRSEDRTARRYHWHSGQLSSFVETPHAGIIGVNQGQILNLTAIEAAPARENIVALTSAGPDQTIRDLQRLIMPAHHHVTAEDIDLKRLGTVLWVAQDAGIDNMENLLLLEGVGPRTIQSLALVSEVIHGTPSRFTDPARFSFAHGGKDGHPFPVPTQVYDETITILENALHRAKVGITEKKDALKKLHEFAVQKEKDFISTGSLDELIAQERKDNWKYGGKTVFGDAKAPVKPDPQLKLF